MDSLTVALPEDLRLRLESIAERTGCGVEESLLLAVTDYVRLWEAHLDDVTLLDTEERVALRAANE